MKASMKKKWVPMAGAFLSVFGSFAALMYISVTTFSEGKNQPGSPFFRFHQSQTQSAVLPSTQPRSNTPVTHPTDISKLVLGLNRDNVVGKAVLTYRGLEGPSTFRLDVRVPELDAQYTYLHKINIAQARKGFQVGGEHLKLISASRSKIRLLRKVPGGS